MKPIEVTSGTTVGAIPVLCPASPLGDPHRALYDVTRGIWKCKQCGLGGNAEGFARLNTLEAERHRLSIELEIVEWEKELLTNG